MNTHNTKSSQCMFLNFADDILLYTSIYKHNVIVQENYGWLWTVWHWIIDVTCQHLIKIKQNAKIFEWTTGIIKYSRMFLDKIICIEYLIWLIIIIIQFGSWLISCIIDFFSFFHFFYIKESETIEVFSFWFWQHYHLTSYLYLFILLRGQFS